MLRRCLANLLLIVPPPSSADQTKRKGERKTAVFDEDAVLYSKNERMQRFLDGLTPRQRKHYDIAAIFEDPNVKKGMKQGIKPHRIYDHFNRPHSVDTVAVAVTTALHPSQAKLRNLRVISAVDFTPSTMQRQVLEEIQRAFPQRTEPIDASRLILVRRCYPPLPPLSRSSSSSFPTRVARDGLVAQEPLYRGPSAHRSHPSPHLSYAVYDREALEREGGMDVNAWLSGEGRRGGEGEEDWEKDMSRDGDGDIVDAMIHKCLAFTKAVRRASSSRAASSSSATASPSLPAFPPSAVSRRYAASAANKAPFCLGVLHVPPCLPQTTTMQQRCPPSSLSTAGEKGGDGATQQQQQGMAAALQTLPSSSTHIPTSILTFADLLPSATTMARPSDHRPLASLASTNNNAPAMCNASTCVDNNNDDNTDSHNGVGLFLLDFNECNICVCDSQRFAPIAKHHHSSSASSEYIAAASSDSAVERIVFDWSQPVSPPMEAFLSAFMASQKQQQGAPSPRGVGGGGLSDGIDPSSSSSLALRRRAFLLTCWGRLSNAELFVSSQQWSYRIDAVAWEMLRPMLEAAERDAAMASLLEEALAHEDDDDENEGGEAAMEGEEDGNGHSLGISQQATAHADSSHQSAEGNEGRHEGGWVGEGEERHEGGVVGGVSCGIHSVGEVDITPHLGVDAILERSYTPMRGRAADQPGYVPPSPEELEEERRIRKGIRTIGSTISFPRHHDYQQRQGHHHFNKRNRNRRGGGGGNDCDHDDDDDHNAYIAPLSEGPKFGSRFARQAALFEQSMMLAREKRGEGEDNSLTAAKNPCRRRRLSPRRRPLLPLHHPKWAPLPYSKGLDNANWLTRPRMMCQEMKYGCLELFT